MRSKVAADLRAEQVELVRDMTPAERVSLALQLGERDLSVYMTAQKVDRNTALRAIRRSRQTGRRRPSRCLDESLQ